MPTLAISLLSVLVASCCPWQPEALVPDGSGADGSAMVASRPHAVAQDPAQKEGARKANRHAAFDRILAAHVRDERVDYLAVRKSAQEELAGYLKAMAALDVKALPRDEQLAVYINVYNASMIMAVVDRLDAEYTPAKDGYAVFDEKLVRVGGRRISLNELENEIIRPTFEEPRIHVALVCGARSCPPLLPRAYRAADLEQLLERNMVAFLGQGERNQVDHAQRRLKLSQIFNWYAQDFGGPQGVPT